MQYHCTCHALSPLLPAACPTLTCISAAPARAAHLRRAPRPPPPPPPPLGRQHQEGDGGHALLCTRRCFPAPPPHPPTYPPAGSIKKETEALHNLLKDDDRDFDEGELLLRCPSTPPIVRSAERQACAPACAHAAPRLLNPSTQHG